MPSASQRQIVCSSLLQNPHTPCNTPSKCDRHRVRKTSCVQSWVRVAPTVRARPGPCLSQCSGGQKLPGALVLRTAQPLSCASGGAHSSVIY
eukprot:6188135-Pleurochrysis_carterae.AAC.7